MAVLVGAVVTKPPTLLDSPIAVFVGQISYGMYLLHWFVTVTLERVLPEGTSLVLYFALCVSAVCALAAVMACVWERPISGWFRPRLDRWAARPHPVPRRMVADAPFATVGKH